jgi:uroporphyrinogen-III synthase
MRLIVTRPEEDAGRLKDRLESLGHQVTLMPLLKIVPRAGVEIPKIEFQAVCATSANSLRSLSDSKSIRHVPIYTVGTQSLAAAGEAGFLSAGAHGGDVEGLAAYIIANRQPSAGPILYLSGAEVSGDLKGTLEAAGFEMTKVITYDAMPQYPDDIEQALASHDGVLLYSPRTARIFADAAGVRNKGLIHYCLSQNVARALPAVAIKQVAKSPDETSLLALLD